MKLLTLALLVAASAATASAEGVRLAAAKCAGPGPGSFAVTLFGVINPPAKSPVPVCGSTGIGELDFPDNDGEYSVSSHFKLDKDFKGVMNMTVVWRSSATQGVAEWNVKGGCITDESGHWSHETSLSDTAAGHPLRINTAKRSFNANGCVAGDTYYFWFFRNRLSPADTITGVLKLLSLEFTY